jgi:lipopolysaccharide biosynthesis regulator YciM
MEGLKDYLEENLFEDLRDNEGLESGLADAIVKELGTDTTDYTEESLDSVLVSYIMEQLSNRVSVEIANMNYIVKVIREYPDNQASYDRVDMSGKRQRQAMIPASVGYMLDLIEEDLTEQIDYIREECFDPELLAEYLELNHGVEVAE